MGGQESDMNGTLRISGLLLVGLFAWTAGPAPRAVAQTQTTAPAGRLKRSQRPDIIARFLQYKLDLYGRHIKSKDWIARVMGVISLAKIDHPETTETIIKVMRSDRMPLVRIYAWEALHSRLDRLTRPQQDEWVKTGKDLFRRRELQGDLKLGLVDIMEAAGPTRENKAFFMKMFNACSASHGGDIRTLQALGDLLSKWRSADLAKWLLRRMRHLDTAWRSEIVLGRLDSSIPNSQTLFKRSTTEMWRTTYGRWRKWLGEADLKEIEPPDKVVYKAKARFLPRGEKITDTKAPKWRKDLELGEFRLNYLDVGFAVDATGSMGSTLRWIERDLSRMMRTFAFISRYPRIGISLYRDRGEQYLVRTFPLSGDAAKLSRAMKAQNAVGGGDIPEAVLAALNSLIRKNWSEGAKSKRVIVLLGDAPPHQNTMERIEKLVTDAAKKGFVFFTFKVKTYGSTITKGPNWDPELASFDKIAAWGGGNSHRIWFPKDAGNNRWYMVPRAPNESFPPDRLIFREILRAAMPQGFGDRIDPFISVLLEYVDRSVPEKRAPFAAYRSSGPHKPRDPQK